MNISSGRFLFAIAVLATASGTFALLTSDPRDLWVLKPFAVPFCCFVGGLVVGSRAERLYLQSKGMLRTIFFLLLLASPAVAENVIVRDYIFWQNYPAELPITGSVAFSITGEGVSPVGFTYPVPPLSAFHEGRIIESTAATYGLDWIALEAILIGDDQRATTLGMPGYEVTVPYLRRPGEGYVGSIDLDHVLVRWVRGGGKG